MSSMEDKIPVEFSNAIKLIALFQAVLEQMDTLKGTRLYRQKIKNQINQLEKSIEQTILAPLSQIDTTDDEGLFDRIQKNIEMVMQMTADDLSQLKIVLDE